MRGDSTSYTIRERLILAGIEEIRLHGLQDFSLRKAASACGVSCAAPYKHFKNKNDFILSIIQYIQQQWYTIQNQILVEYPSDTRRRILEIGVAYIQFLVENPHFRSFIMLNDPAMSKPHLRMISEMSQCSADLIRQYCEQVHMPDDVRIRKTFVVRSLLYGAAMMFDNGELPYTPENLQTVRRMIDREFDLE